MNFTRTLMILFIVASPAATFAKEYACETIYWDDEAVPTIHASINHPATITFPRDVAFAEAGNPILWKSDTRFNFTIVKPTSPLADGESTVYNVITADKKRYQFLLLRSKYKRPFCYTVKLHENMFGDQVAPVIQPPSSSTNTYEIQALQSENAALREQVSTSKEKMYDFGDALLKKYRRSIYPHYEVVSASGVSKEVVKAVYDDTRFTIVRVDSSYPGVFVAHALIDDKIITVQYDHDDELDEYMIYGIYDKIILKSDASSIEIARNQ